MIFDNQKIHSAYYIRKDNGKGTDGALFRQSVSDWDNFEVSSFFVTLTDLCEESISGVRAGI